MEEKERKIPELMRAKFQFFKVNRKNIYISSRKPLKIHLTPKEQTQLEKVSKQLTHLIFVFCLSYALTGSGHCFHTHSAVAITCTTKLCQGVYKQTPFCGLGPSLGKDESSTSISVLLYIEQKT